MDITNQAMQMLELMRIPVLAVLVAAGFLTLLFGRKIYRFWVMIGGIAAGIIGGEKLARFVEVPEIVILAAGVILALVFGVIACKSNRGGVFLLSLEVMCAAGIVIGGMGSYFPLITGAILGMIIGLIGLKFPEPVSIIMTALFGGLMAAEAGIELIRIEGLTWKYIVWMILFIVGMAVQFMIEGRKKSRQDVRAAEDIKAKVSVENDVEAARTMILDLEDGKAEDADK